MCREVLPHSFYSADLAPSDFHLFGPLREAWRGKRFQDNEDVKKFVGNCSNSEIKSSLQLVKESLWSVGTSQRLVANFSQDPLDAAQATFRVTSRGRLQLVQNNYVYHCNRQKDNKIFWKCAEYNRTGCRGRCISIGWAVTVTHALHNHHPSWSESTDESKVISDLSEMRHMFASPRPVTDKNFPRNLPKQLNDTSPINIEGF
ncbi:hypothetical protein J6590_010438 [Homalodisca vitripennis]|nr:hypothetical protein J6590_010438 [Homalodisca vitripennis]